MKVSSNFRAEARDNLKNNWGTAILVCIIITAISTLLNIIPVIGSIAVFLITGQLAVGQYNYFINLHNRGKASFECIFDNFGANWLNNFVAYLLQTIYTILWSLLFIIPGIIKNYSYSMTMYIKAKEPNLDANTAIAKSMKMMDGYKWKLFCLHFSFIGWSLLSILTFGIGFLFLYPYMQASVTAFYEDRYNANTQPDIVTETIIIEEPDIKDSNE